MFRPGPVFVEKSHCSKGASWSSVLQESLAGKRPAVQIPEKQKIVNQNLDIYMEEDIKTKKGAELS